MNDNPSESTLQPGSNSPSASGTSMTLDQAQSEVDRWIKKIGVRYFSELTNLAQLVEEVGELARLVSRTYGEQSFKPGEAADSIPDELADILFVLICLANQMDINLNDALVENLKKKTGRDATRHLTNPKLDSRPG